MSVIKEVRRFLLLASIFLGRSSQAQDFFPLHVGDHWQYEVYFQGTFRGYYDVRILGDSTMPNGKKYYNTTEPWRWVRVNDSLSSYIYDFFNKDNDTTTTELLLDKFGALVGDWWYSYGFERDSSRMENFYNSTVFGELTSVKVISRYAPIGLWITTRDYSRKHGLIYYLVEGGASYYLVGANIGGIVYGTITSIESPTFVARDNIHVNDPYPNPFNSTVTITFETPSPANVAIRIFDILGRSIRKLSDETREAGYHITRWDLLDDTGIPCPSGVYFIQISSSEGVVSKRILAIR